MINNWTRFINKGVLLLVRGRNVLIRGDLFIKKGTNCINKGGILLIRFLLIGAGCLINKGTNCINKGRRVITGCDNEIRTSVPGALYTRPRGMWATTCSGQAAPRGTQIGTHRRPRHPRRL